MQIKYHKGTTGVESSQGGAAERTDGAEQRRKGPDCQQASSNGAGIKAQICSTKSQGARTWRLSRCPFGPGAAACTVLACATAASQGLTPPLSAECPHEGGKLSRKKQMTEALFNLIKY